MTSFLLFFKSNKKIIGIISAIVTIVVGLGSIKNHYIKVGYTKAVVEIQSKTNEAVVKATNAAIIDAQEKATVALRQQQQLFDSELTRVRSERIVEERVQEIIKYVDKVEIKNECLDVGPDVLGLLNATISSVSKPSN